MVSIIKSSTIVLRLILCGYVFAAPAVSQPSGISDDNDNSSDTRQSWFERRYRWPNGRVAYELSPEYSTSDIEVIVKAMNEWELKTCIRFESRQPSYVFITPNDNRTSYCYSYVGRQGGQQVMKMYGECIRHAAIVHELGHVIGFNHEQQRPDRDNYIIVHFENIDPEYRFAFHRLSADVDTMRTQYDLSSIMQYPYFSFGYNESTPAMTLKDGSIDAIYNEAEDLSKLDVFRTQLFYRNCVDNEDITVLP